MVSIVMPFEVVQLTTVLSLLSHACCCYCRFVSYHYILFPFRRTRDKFPARPVLVRNASRTFSGNHSSVKIASGQKEQSQHSHKTQCAYAFMCESFSFFFRLRFSGFRCIFPRILGFSLSCHVCFSSFLTK